MLDYEKLIAGLRSYASLRLLTQLFSWLGTIYVIRHLGSRALGEYAVALVVFNYLSMTFDGTLLETLVQRPPATGQIRRATFSLVLGIGLFLAIVTVGLSGALAGLVGDAAVAPLVSGVAAAFVLASLCVLPQAILARRMEFPRLARIAAIQAICVTVTTVGLVALGVGAWALVAGQIVGAGVRMVLLNACCYSLPWPTWRIGGALSYVGFAGVLLADNLLWRWYTSLDTFLLGRWAGTGQLGLYSLSQQLAELPLEKIATLVNDISLPAYAEARDHPGAARQLLLETLRTHATAGFPLFWGLAAVASLAVPILFGAGWQLSVFPLVALAAVAPLRLIGSIETPAMTGIGRPGVLLRTKLIIAPCMTVALIVACRLGGIDGAALAWLGMFPICYAFAFRYVLRAAELPYREVLAVMRGPALAAALMVAVVVAWESLAAGTVGSAPPVLISAIGVGVVVYGAGLRCFDPLAFRLAQARLGRLVGLGQPA